MSPSDEYTKALDKSLGDLLDRVQRRDLLNAEIAGLRETVRVLIDRVQMSDEKQRHVAQLLAMVDYATPSLTDAVRALLTRVYPKELTAVDVRNALESSKFNFDDFSNSLSACHAALKRIVADKEAELGEERDGKATYKRVLRPFKSGDLAATMAGLSGSRKPGARTRALGSDVIEDMLRQAFEGPITAAIPPDHPLHKLRAKPRRNPAFYGEDK
jgi:hypothetical protein